MKSGLKEATIALVDVYYFNVNTQNTGKLILLVTQVEKRMDLVKTSLEEVKGSLENMKGILGNMQKIIGGVL